MKWNMLFSDLEAFSPLFIKIKLLKHLKFPFNIFINNTNYSLCISRT